MRNEAPFILEWIAYHRAIGFDDFLIYSNDCSDGNGGPNPSETRRSRLIGLAILVPFDVIDVFGRLHGLAPDRVIGDFFRNLLRIAFACSLGTDCANDVVTPAHSLQRPHSAPL